MDKATFAHFLRYFPVSYDFPPSGQLPRSQVENRRLAQVRPLLQD